LFEKFCEEKGHHHNVSTPRTPHRVVERKNWSLQEMTRTMLNKFYTPKCFWVEDINIYYYVLNRVILILKLKMTPYEL
jgi:hypothetical protein